MSPKSLPERERSTKSVQKKKVGGSCEATVNYSIEKINTETENSSCQTKTTNSRENPACPLGESAENFPAIAISSKITYPRGGGKTGSLARRADRIVRKRAKIFTRKRRGGARVKCLLKIDETTENNTQNARGRREKL
uniref:(northern house mosquito) hypothetical protein n=1 Tax=Culex pipiens TaxID=7175 RepID=A0A8D8BMM5_CULPI